MSNVPETSWLPLTQPNPEWRWWKPWVPRSIKTKYGQLSAEDLIEAIPFKRVDHGLPDDAIQFGHICFFLSGVEGHIDLTCEPGMEEPTDFADAADSAKKAFSIALDEIAKQVKG